MTKKKPKFNFVIARVHKETGRLSCYCLYGEIQHGNDKDAKKMLKYVKKQQNVDTDLEKRIWSDYSDWKIVKLVSVIDENL